MGVDPPFLYDRPSSSSFAEPTGKSFNPKSVSQASWAPRPPRPKQTGPLISAKELNRHPDSFFASPYGNLGWKPPSPNTKKKVKWTRITQLVLRVFALLGACGLLFCIITLTNLDPTLGWIIRIAPGVAILHLTYAVYHLCRSSNGRTPASSASYMIFAAVVDATLLPFFALTTIMAYRQYVDDGYSYKTPNTGLWNTLFNSAPQTHLIIWLTYILGIVEGAIHLTSLFLDIYLAIVFHKIAKLPPDLNPLEDNLTSRHKRNKSSISMADSVNARDSHLSAPLMSPPRTMPFMHTRTESSTSLSSPERSPERGSRATRSSYTTQGSRASYTSLPSQVYQQPSSQRSSRGDLQDLRRSPLASPKRNSAYPDSRPTSARQTPTRPISMPSPAPDENWVTYPSPSPSPPNDDLPEFRHLRAMNGQRTMSTADRYDYSSRSPRPLEMNPPTPPIASRQRWLREDRALTPTHANSSPATREELEFLRDRPEFQDDGFMANGKTRFYGNLEFAGKRVVSSGNDAGNLHVLGMRGRDVSGKVAEEGRGTGRYS